VIINDLDLVGPQICPFKANPILVIDPDAVLAFAATGQRFKLIPRWDSQFLKLRYRIQQIKFTGSHFPQGGWAEIPCILGVIAVENVLCARIFEGLYHKYMIARITCYVNAAAGAFVKKENEVKFEGFE
jgi:hypothetical protein